MDETDLRAKVNDLEATVMLLGGDLEALTLALHEQRKEMERLKAEVTRLREAGLEPMPADERPPHY